VGSIPIARSNRMPRSRLLILSAALAAVALAIAAASWRFGEVRAELARPFDRHGTGYVGSNTCRSCHQDRHASWYRTWHRTMTQEASAQSVQGQFDGRIVEYWGVAVRPVARDGRYYFEYLGPDRQTVTATAQVARTVGSHRYQQYLAQVPGTGQNYHRLQLLWHKGDRRWVHLNGAFLHDDRQHYSAPVTTWNHNCIFCHNTGPEPNAVNYEALIERIGAGEKLNVVQELRYESKVAELGIACESCHGPGAEHSRRNRDPLRRYWLQATDASDPTIVNPAKLDAVRSAQVCGACHAQRVPATMDLMENWLHTGPTYRPGDNLLEHVRPVTAAEPGPPDNPDLFRKRFWADGTPRLSAYELTGLQMSACFQQGELSCLNCHDAHGGDVNGMMRDDGRTDAPCLACHQQLADVARHTHHPADSPASRCTSCHMPPMVYGVMEIHRSHRIEVPAPLANAQAERPNACIGCHLDRDAAWAGARIAAWAGRPPPAAQPAAVDEHVRQLLGGDPVQRAVAAKLAGRPDSALTPAQRLALVPTLLLAMEDDYPAVRRFAQHSARSIAAAAGAGALAQALEPFDFIAPAPQRAAALATIRAAWRQHVERHALAIPEPDAALVAALRREGLRRSVDINIGE
jgi:predicted CXXCH cytochrome family protein